MWGARTAEASGIAEIYGAAGDGLSDDTAALQAAIDNGTQLVLAPGRTYRLDGELTWDLASGPLVVVANGATIDYRGSGAMFTLDASASGSDNTPAVTFLGGTYKGTAEAIAAFKSTDLRHSSWHRVTVSGFTAGDAWWFLNDQFWCERNSLIQCVDYRNRRAVFFDTGSATSKSFARTVIEDLRLQGGASGVAKIDGSTDVGLYDSRISFIGNIANGVICMKLTGSMGGTVVGPVGVEAAVGNMAYLFGVGTLTGALPNLYGSPILRNCEMYSSPPSGAVWAPNRAHGGLVSDNPDPYFGIDIEQRRTSFVSAPPNPVAYVSANPGGGSYPFNAFGHLVLQAAAGRDITLMDDSGNIACSVTDGGILRLGGTSGAQIRSGSGAPEAAVTAPIGSLYLRTDGGEGSTLYVKESGSENTGWSAI
jgi:hypothetical protein